MYISLRNRPAEPASEPRLRGRRRIPATVWLLGTTSLLSAATWDGNGGEAVQLVVDVHAVAAEAGDLVAGVHLLAFLAHAALILVEDLVEHLAHGGGG